jgi:hypothetical protein
MSAKPASGMDQDFYPWSPIFARPPLRWQEGARVALAASQFSLIANTLQQGDLHNAVQNLAGRLIRKGVAEGPPGADPVLGPAASARDRSR